MASELLAHTVPPRVHDSARVASGVALGDGCEIRAEAVVGAHAHIGTGTIIGARSYVGRTVFVGKGCVVEDDVQLHEPALIEDSVQIGAGAILANGAALELAGVVGARPGSPNAAGGGRSRQGRQDAAVAAVSGADILHGVIVRAGAVIGAGAVCTAPLIVGRWAVIEPGAVVSGDIPDHAVMAGNPAQQVAWVGRTRTPLINVEGELWQCPATGESYRLSGGAMRRCAPPAR
jgi:UDP-2-acetamido-3-amino-2,3-dideoxy-glucuronate N-acetyltransferase